MQNAGMPTEKEFEKALLAFMKIGIDWAPPTFLCLEKDIPKLVALGVPRKSIRPAVIEKEG